MSRRPDPSGPGDSAPQPLVSVVTPVYNGERMISRCYWSLCKQTWTDWEWVVVDDGSTDGTCDVLRRIADSDDRVRVVSYTPNRGRGYARTASLREVKADWTVLWDADDLYMPHRLARIDAARSPRDHRRLLGDARRAGCPSCRPGRCRRASRSPCSASWACRAHRCRSRDR